MSSLEQYETELIIETLIVFKSNHIQREIHVFYDTVKCTRIEGHLIVTASSFTEKVSSPKEPSSMLIPKPQQHFDTLLKNC